MDKTHVRETHGRSNDIDETTPIDRVKGANIFERAKEEIEAIVETIHPKKVSDNEAAGKEAKPHYWHEGGKEETQVTKQEEKIHHKETHGTSDDIDEDTPIDKVKGPNIFERAKEELEALVETIHPKKEHEDKAEGFWENFGKRLEKLCCPLSAKRD